MGLLDLRFGRVPVEAAQTKGAAMAATEEQVKKFVEHNSTSPNSDAKDQCQCEDCKAYRAAK
jgi:hypothetical protein